VNVGNLRGLDVFFYVFQRAREINDEFRDLKSQNKFVVEDQTTSITTLKITIIS
jgi:hypothetical protein